MNETNFIAICGVGSVFSISIFESSFRVDRNRRASAIAYVRTIGRYSCDTLLNYMVDEFVLTPDFNW